ncbi:uncharacterized protein V3H82_002004 [Fundulus diaphanus]
MSLSPTQSPVPASHLSSLAETMFLDLRKLLDTLPTVDPPWVRVDTAESLWNLYKDQTTVLSALGITGLAEEIGWIKQAAYAQILHRPPPTRPPLASLSAAAAAPVLAVSAISAAPPSAVSAAAAAPASAVSAAAAAPASAVPAAPATVAATVSTAAPDASPSAAVSTSLPGSSWRRRRTRRPRISPEAKPYISAEAAPTAADVTSFSPVSRPSADAAAQESLARAPCLHEDQLWDFFYGDRDDLLPCWSAPDKTRTVYEARMYTALPAIAEVPTANATAQACVGVRNPAQPADASPAQPADASPAQPADASPAQPADATSTLLAIVEIPAAHAMAKACMGAHISPPPVFADVPPAAEKKDPPAAEREDLPAADKKGQPEPEASAGAAVPQPEASDDAAVPQPEPEASAGAAVPQPEASDDAAVPQPEASVGAHISPLPVFTDFPLADERKEPPAVERKEPPQAEILQCREGVQVDPLLPYAPESSKGDPPPVKPPESSEAVQGDPLPVSSEAVQGNPPLVPALQSREAVQGNSPPAKAPETSEAVQGNPPPVKAPRSSTPGPPSVTTTTRDPAVSPPDDCASPGSPTATPAAVLHGARRGLSFSAACRVQVVLHGACRGLFYSAASRAQVVLHGACRGLCCSAACRAQDVHHRSQFPEFHALKFPEFHALKFPEFQRASSFPSSSALQVSRVPARFKKFLFSRHLLLESNPPILSTLRPPGMGVLVFV